MPTDFWDSILEIVSDTPPTPAQRRADALQAIDDWLRSTFEEGATRWFCPRLNFASRLTKLVNEPGCLHQGSYGWCMPVAFLFCMLRRFPDVVARYGIALYDTGSSALGDLDMTVSDDLMNFDLPRYARGELEGHPLPAGRSMLDVEQVDWILMAGLADAATFPYNFGGPINFNPGLLPLPEEVEDYFEETGLYGFAGVGVTRLSSSLTPQELFALLNKPNADIVLIGKLDDFANGLTSVPMVDHATVLTDVRLEGGVVQAKYWSWGDRLPPAFEAISTPGSIFSLPNDIGGFLQVVDTVVIAQA